MLNGEIPLSLKRAEFLVDYVFDMKSWWNPLNWIRNIETTIGTKVAGKGTPYDIYFYGYAKLTPIFPWVK